MPTYEYLCDNCGHEFEKFQSISSKPLRKCPACGRRQLKRLIGTGAGIIFKGSGFYETDYRSESYKKAEEKEKPKAADKKTEKADSDKSTTDTADKNKGPKAKKNAQSKA